MLRPFVCALLALAWGCGDDAVQIVGDATELAPDVLGIDTTPATFEPPAPDLPVATSLVAIPGDGHVVVQWKAPVSLPVLGARVVWWTDDPETTKFDVTKGATRYVIEGLENGVEVSVAVHLVFAPGTAGPATAPVAATPTAESEGLVSIPAGPFEMGWEPPLHGPDESPAHVVWLDAYAIDRYPVTVGQYAACVEAGGCPPPLHPYGYVDGVGFVADLAAEPDAITHPVVGLDRERASLLCAYRGMRLPTEAEWEKAARGPGPDRYPYPWGSVAPDCERTSFWDGVWPCTTGTRTVGAYPGVASPYGVRDMAGGVWEWTQDGYDAEFYAHSPSVDPIAPWADRASVVRGGAWDAPSASLFTTARREGFVEWVETGDPIADYRPYGVRCVLD